MRRFTLIAVAVIGLLGMRATADDDIISRLHVVGAEPDNCPAKPAKGDHLMVCGPDTVVFAAGGTPIDFAPTWDKLGAVPITALLVVDGTIASKAILDSTHKMPVFHFPVPQFGVHTHRTQVVVMDDAGRNTEIQRCTVITRTASTSTQMQLLPAGEAIQVTIPNRSELGAVHLFMNGQSIGRISSGKPSAMIDARILGAGKYHVCAIAEDKDGSLLPVTATDVEITPRFSVVVDVRPGDIVIPVDTVSAKLNVTISKPDIVQAARIHVFFADQYVGVIESGRGVVSLDVRNVPSGPATIEVVGVGSDGTLYWPELKTLNIVNKDWQDRMEHSDAYGETLDLKTQIAEEQKQAVYWYTMAINEPKFHDSEFAHTISSTDEFGRNLSITVFDTIRTEGKAKEYFAECSVHITQMAQLQLTLGSLYYKLKMREYARGSFSSIIREMGGKGIQSDTAKAQLAMLDNEKRQNVADMLKQ